jgi:hypothetical protein
MQKDAKRCKNKKVLIEMIKSRCKKDANKKYIKNIKIMQKSCNS